MLIKDFVDQYTLHDSLIESILYNDNEKRLEMVIDFCSWMQDGYKDTEPETGIILLTFEGVDAYNGIVGEVNSFSILDFLFDNTTVRINILDDFHNEFYEVCFMADAVTMPDIQCL